MEQGPVSAWSHTLEFIRPVFIMIQCENHSPFEPPLELEWNVPESEAKCIICNSSRPLPRLYSWCEIDTLSFLLTCFMTSIAAFMLNSNWFEQPGSVVTYKCFLNSLQKLSARAKALSLSVTLHGLCCNYTLHERTRALYFWFIVSIRDLFEVHHPVRHRKVDSSLLKMKTSFW